VRDLDVRARTAVDNQQDATRVSHVFTDVQGHPACLAGYVLCQAVAGDLVW